MKMDVFVPGEPPVVPWFVSAQIVEDHMDLLLGRHIFYHLIHKVEELAPPSPLCVHERHVPFYDVEGGEESGGAMPLVLVGKTGESAAAGEAQIALGPLQRLDTRLLIHRDHQSALRGRKVEADDIGRFGGERRIGGDAP